MDETAKRIVSDSKKKLLKDLPKFLELEGKEKFFLGKKIDVYSSDALEELEGHFDIMPEFAKFVDVLYGCKQLDNFGESWAPTEEKILAWIEFLKKFKN